MERRVVITGMGAVSPLGLDVPALWRSIVEKRSGVGRITLFDPSDLEVQIAAEVKGFDPANYMDRKEARRNDRFVHFAVAATKEAMRSANLTIDEDNADDVAVIIGSGIGGLTSLSEQFKVFFEKGPGRVSPFLVPMMITNMAGGIVSILTGARGPNYSPVSACATSTNAIGEGMHLIKRGAAKTVIAGGAEAPIVPMALAAFNSARALSTRNDEPETASRPFDATRDGFVMGEGAAVLVMEDLSYALERGAPILAEVVGYGWTSDAYHITAPAEGGVGMVKAMRLALREAGLKPEEIDYLNAHGTSTPANDRTETQAIKTVFGDYAYKLPISSSKSYFGHLLGAAGAMESVVSILGMQNNLIPPTINLKEPDPECDLDYVPNEPRPARIDTLMNNSMGFGGHNVSLIFRRYND
ncbi:MAG: 3-oxoacyl-[acyl-carrier-protein] synthase 2 [Herpetosiphonaceae bacterium]|nr:MAG: 3-oxoacyl-[acyl-carrier-protein] synthase 2 [Herpetosiphonaceae bacterium]